MLALFGAGGQQTAAGKTYDADERQDELAFALLAERAKYSATIFDLRPLRPLLHQIPPDQRSALQANLIYWADSYDALICYKTVTPLKPELQREKVPTDTIPKQAGSYRSSVGLVLTNAL